MTGDLITAAQAAGERGISESRMRDLIAARGLKAVAREPGRGGRNLYPADEVRAIPAPARGQRNDLTAQRIGEMFALAKTIAGDAHYVEWSKLDERLLTGTPAAVRNLLPAVRRWARRKPVHAAALARIGELAEQVGDLGAAFLPLRMREQIMLAEAQALVRARTDLQPEEG